MITAPRTPNEGFVEFVLFERVCMYQSVPYFFNFFFNYFIAHSTVYFLYNNKLKISSILKYLLLLSNLYNLHFFNFYFLFCNYFLNNFFVLACSHNSFICILLFFFIVNKFKKSVINKFSREQKSRLLVYF